jgi:hypothetical protein
MSNFKVESEGSNYYACQFNLNEFHILSRNAKVTPKKVGQFVTCWKRDASGQTVPFSERDSVDFYAINVKLEDKFGQFVFPKSILAKKGIISTERSEGKRGFRVYPKWDAPTSKQAEKTQQWQLAYFYEINEFTDLSRANELYKG